MECNINYFENIDTEEKAYWLGFLYADGCVSQDYKYLYVCLSSKDLKHLELFNKCIDSNYKIKYRDNNRYISLVISKKKFVEHLIDKGCIPTKSLILKFPTEDQVPKELIRHFIRGYFDGDGCISTILRKLKNKPNLIMDCEINFLGTFDMLSGICENIPVKNIKIFEFGKIFKFRVRNKKDIIEIMEYLYKDSNIYLERKHEKYINNVINYKTKRHPLNKENNNYNPVTITVL